MSDSFLRYGVLLKRRLQMTHSRLRTMASVVLGTVVVTAILHFSAPRANADPAVVVKPDGACLVPAVDGNGNMDLLNGVVTSDTMAVENGNKVALTCKATVPNLSGKGQRYKGFPCNVAIPSGGFAVTTDSSLTVSASGEATLKCTYRP
jgi:hypothetical protein